MSGHSFLFLITSSSVLAVLFIFFFVARDAWPFLSKLAYMTEMFTSKAWYPSATPGAFGGLALFYGSAIVTFGAIVIAAPLGVAAAICLSDILPFAVRQLVKPVIEVLAAIPSVAFGFFALVVFALALQNHGGALLSGLCWVVGGPVLLLALFVLSDLVPSTDGRPSLGSRIAWMVGPAAVSFGGLYLLSDRLSLIEISSGTNALNVSIILGIMALPTVVSVSEDALQSVGRDLREGAYALGATRAEVLLKVILPAAASGIGAAVILGVMRAVGETMVVWMASGNAAQIPEPWFNFLEPVRTLTATIAGEMGEADHVTGSARYHGLFALAFCLLSFSFICNLIGEWIIRRSQLKKG